LEKEFNLLYEPWILVRTKNNEIKEWSLLDTFKYAHEAKCLAGELATQNVAILRLLLAVLHATFVHDNVQDSDDAIELWQRIWNEKHFEYEKIESYLKSYEDRFWLFHPKTPFYQVADIENAMKKFQKDKGKKVNDSPKPKSVARLIGELSQSDNQFRLFAGRCGKYQNFISYAEAARWLLHLNGFDDNSAKNPVPKGFGYLGQLGLVYATGKTIFETVLLNWVLVDRRNKPFSDISDKTKAYWEKPVCTKIENLIVQPNAQKDLLTMQSRRILLLRDKRNVVGYFLTMGDYFDKDKGLENEQMSLWRMDGNLIKPKLHMSERQVWREFSTLMCTSDDAIEAGVIRWLKFLEENEMLDKKEVCISIAGVCYDPDMKKPTKAIVDFVDDHLSVSASILLKLADVWIDNITKTLQITADAVKQLGWLASNIASATGNSGDDGTDKWKKKIRENAREQCYAELDIPFREWLVSIDVKKDKLNDKVEEWLAIAKNIILADGSKLLSTCSDSALTGRIKKQNIKGNDVEVSTNVFEAIKKFNWKINELLGKEEK